MIKKSHKKLIISFFLFLSLSYVYITGSAKYYKRNRKLYNLEEKENAHIYTKNHSSLHNSDYKDKVPEKITVYDNLSSLMKTDDYSESLTYDQFVYYFELRKKWKNIEFNDFYKIIMKYAFSSVYLHFHNFSSNYPYSLRSNFILEPKEDNCISITDLEEVRKKYLFWHDFWGLYIIDKKSKIIHPSRNQKVNAKPGEHLLVVHSNSYMGYPTKIVQLGTSSDLFLIRGKSRELAFSHVCNTYINHEIHDIDDGALLSLGTPIEPYNKANFFKFRNRKKIKKETLDLINENKIKYKWKEADKFLQLQFNDSPSNSVVCDNCYIYLKRNERCLWARINKYSLLSSLLDHNSQIPEIINLRICLSCAQEVLDREKIQGGAIITFQLINKKGFKIKSTVKEAEEKLDIEPVVKKKESIIKEKTNFSKHILLVTSLALITALMGIILYMRGKRKPSKSNKKLYLK